MESHNHYALTGKEFDENTGLTWFGARHYDAGVGVWIRQDDFRGLLKYPMSLYRYGYVHQNPVVYYDENGYAIPLVLAYVGKAMAVGAVEQVASTYVRDVVDDVTENVLGDGDHGLVDIITPNTDWKGYAGQAIGGMTVFPFLQEPVGNTFENYFIHGEFSTLEKLITDATLGGISGGFSRYVSSKTASRLIPHLGGRPAKKIKTFFFGRLAQKDYARKFIVFVQGEIFKHTVIEHVAEPAVKHVVGLFFERHLKSIRSHEAFKKCIKPEGELLPAALHPGDPGYNNPTTNFG